MFWTSRQEFGNDPETTLRELAGATFVGVLSANRRAPG
jgi:hypothetical protein